MRSTKLDNKSRRAWLLAAGLALFCQSAYPSGYMPGSVADGWPVVLCPEGLPAEFISRFASADHGHHHDDGHADAGPRLADYCQLSSVLDEPVTVATAALAAEPAGRNLTVAPLRLLRSARPVGSSFHPRAPPPV